MNKKHTGELKAVDFFCCGGGMSYGMQESGIKVIAGIDIDESCKSTYEANIAGKFVHADITKLSTKQLQNETSITRADDDMIFIGCSPCQYWSVMRTNKDVSQDSKNLLMEFLEFVVYFKPGYVVVENVPGILKRKDESQLTKFIDTLKKKGYEVEYKILSLHDYEVPQSRKRFSLIANRLGKAIHFPDISDTKLTVRDAIGDPEIYPEIPAGHKDHSDFMHSTAGLAPINLARLKLTPKDGGMRESWANTDLQLKTYKKNNIGFKDTYSRMYWDKPAPTITTKFFSISNGRFVHPEQDRPISLREGATLQTFPTKYKFIGKSVAAIGKMIGNAVPPEYARRLGAAIGKNHE